MACFSYWKQLNALTMRWYKSVSAFLAFRSDGEMKVHQTCLSINGGSLVITNIFHWSIYNKWAFKGGHNVVGLGGGAPKNVVPPYTKALCQLSFKLLLNKNIPDINLHMQHWCKTKFTISKLERFVILLFLLCVFRW